MLAAAMMHAGLLSVPRPVTHMSPVTYIQAGGLFGAYSK